jgi:hypothetical protein
MSISYSTLTSSASERASFLVFSLIQYQKENVTGAYSKKQKPTSSSSAKVNQVFLD